MEDSLVRRSGSALQQNGVISRIAAVHDLCGYGNCSLGVAIPILSAAGIEVCPVPTSVLSNHTAFPQYSFLDTSSTMADFLKTWKDLNIRLDGIYTGFLGSAEQIELIKAFCNFFPDVFRVIDPVMGDHGFRYKTYTDSMCDGMKRLVPLADVLTPNLTEAAILLDEPYSGQNIRSSQARTYCTRLIEMGARNVVLKGLHRDYTIFNAIMGENIPFQELENEMHPVSLHGTGDLFASCLTACLFSEKSLADAVHFAADFVFRSICLSVSQEGFQERGVSFQPLLSRISNFCAKDSETEYGVS